ncbi:hypothetical protein K2173_009743 [Erythroxylum novogranatense]|uniref:Peptidase A1 domain-containing protein n=1 Tax=Erythroxylum novogranatense TaxID=1862640 RepID=A0AAV8T0I3_9ROSI|nr:hypothetical protein K2173_009743 [Erythroxylum novogranatense]
MGIFWLILCCLSLATASPESQEHESSNNGTAQLKVYHVRGKGSSLVQNSTWSLSDVLLHDEEHVKALTKRLKKKHVKSPSGSRPKLGHLVKPSSASIPLNPGRSIGSGNYYVKLGLGSPPKFNSMIIDTGSSLSWVQCQPCVVSCYPQVDPLFDPKASTSYKKLSCDSPECSSLKSATLNDPKCTNAGSCLYTASYGDSSVSIGYLSQDSLTLSPSQSLPSFTYGCGQYNEGLFGRASGIVGLARDKLSMITQVSTKYGASFTYCLPTATSGSSGGGFLSIGTVSPSSYKFTPMLKNSQNPSLYFLRLATINVGGQPLRLSPSDYSVPTFIDSGTVITRLPMSMYSVLRDAFVKIMSTKYAKAPAFSILDACFKGNLKTITAVPEISMIFQGGAGLPLGAHNSLIEAENGVTCLAFSNSSGIAIIGNHQQQTFSIAYDVSNSRIGFAPGGCH